MKEKNSFVTIWFLMFLVLNAAAEIPKMINFQGRLTDANNNPLNGTFNNMTFRIYATPSGGTPLWSETRSVTVSNGLFFSHLRRSYTNTIYNF